MGRFNDRDNRSGGGRRFGGGGGVRRDSGPREMHRAVCDQCGKDCEVPFKPSGDKPIYCSDCFEKQGGPRQTRPNRSDRSDRPEASNNSKEVVEELKSLNNKLDQILIALTPKPEPEKVKVVEKKASKKK